MDVSDWVRVHLGWRYKDTKLDSKTSLLRFEIPSLIEKNLIQGITLNYYVASSSTSIAPVEVYYVMDDNWDSEMNPYYLLNWPTFLLLSSYSPGVTGWRQISIDPPIFQYDENYSLSIKWFQNSYGTETFAGASYPIPQLRPYLLIDYAGQLLPNLTVYDMDITLDYEDPAGVRIKVTVRNNTSVDAYDVVVQVFDGHPDSGGVQIEEDKLISFIPGLGTGVVDVRWPPSGVERKKHIYVRIDPYDSIEEINENDNLNSRWLEPYSPTLVYFESFEQGFGEWVIDNDVPGHMVPDSGYVQMDWAVGRIDTNAYDGEWSLQFFINGTMDDGTVWIERTIPVMPNTWCSVEVDFHVVGAPSEVTDGYIAVVLDTLDPEMEGDMEGMAIEMPASWQTHIYQRTIYTGERDVIWIAVGFSVTWETPAFYKFLDAIKISYLSLSSSSSYATAFNNGRKLGRYFNGGFFVVYEDSGKVVAVTTTDGGETWKGTIVSDTISYCSTPAFTCHPLRVEVATLWSSEGRLYYSWSSGIPASWREPNLIGNYGTIQTLSLALDSQGVIHATWVSSAVRKKKTTLNDQPGISSNLWYGYWPVSNPESAIVFRLFEGCISSPAIDVDQENDPQLVFARVRDIYYTEKENGIWLTPVNLSESGSRSSFPYIDCQNGRVNVVWQEEGDIFYRTRNPDGSWEEKERIALTPEISSYPVVSGNLVALWSEKDSITGRSKIVYSINDGISWSPPSDLTPEGENCNYPHAVTWAEDGMYYLGAVWTEGDTSPYIVSFERYPLIPPRASEVISLGSKPENRLRAWVHPNPFRKVASFYFLTEKKTRVSLKIYNVSGRLVQSLLEEEKGPGYHRISWDARDKTGRKVPSGVYFFTLITEGESKGGKLLYLGN